MNLVFTRPSKVTERKSQGGQGYNRKLTVLKGAKYKASYGFSDENIRAAMKSGFLKEESVYKKEQERLAKLRELSKKRREVDNLSNALKILESLGYEKKKKK